MWNFVTRTCPSLVSFPCIFFLTFFFIGFKCVFGSIYLLPACFWSLGKELFGKCEGSSIISEFREGALYLFKPRGFALLTILD